VSVATSTRFERTCPGCEAKVPLRDPLLIGKLINCPRCKRRFEVRRAGDEAPEVRARLAARAAVFFYRTARLLALGVVALVGVALYLGAVFLVFASATGIAKVPNEGAVLAVLFVGAAAGAVASLRVASWAADRARKGRTAEEIAHEVSPSEAPAVVREHFRQELISRGHDPDLDCVFVSLGCAAVWVAAALRQRHGHSKANQVLATLAIPELSRTEGLRGWCWRGVNARRKAAMRNLPWHPLPRHAHPPVSALERLQAAWLGAAAGLIVAPLFALAACGFLASSKGERAPEAVARSHAALLPACALVAGVGCAVFGGLRGLYYGGPVGGRLFVQCLLDCSLLNLMGNFPTTSANREKLGANAVLLLLALLVLSCLGIRSRVIPEPLESEPSGLHGRTTRDFMREFEFSGPLGDCGDQFRWWAGLFSYPCCVLLAGLLVYFCLAG
jgi:hypothetical protein